MNGTEKAVAALAKLFESGGCGPTGVAEKDAESFFREHKLVSSEHVAEQILMLAGPMFDENDSEVIRHIANRVRMMSTG